MERFLRVFGIVCAVLVGLIFSNKGRKTEEFKERVSLYGFASLLFGYGIYYVSTYLIDFNVNGEYIDFIFYGDYENPISEVLSLSLFFICFWSYGFAYILFFLAFDLIIKRTKYLLSLIHIVLFILINILLIFDIELGFFIIGYTFRGISVMLIGLVLILYTKWAKLELKAVSSFLMFGFCSIHWGITMSDYNFKEANIIPLFLAPSMFLLGIIIMIIPTILNPSRFTNSLLIWIGGALGSYILIIWGFFVIILAMDMYYSIFYCFFMVYYLGLFTYTIINIRAEIHSKFEKPKKISKHDILGIFTKPQIITEEEVTYYKEQKVCLVCKGRAIRFNMYVCPTCDTLYCQNCANTLSNLENLCWVCNTPFDESKPYKTIEKQETEIYADSEIKNKEAEKRKID